ncbi:MAG: helix-turn-helix domain-containing protein [Firmicutes bacterium]|nr:helix-turn-helix domain-containing protein [Bacillota bacterium]
MHNQDEIITLANMLSKNFGTWVQITVSDTDKYLFVDGAMDASIAVGNLISDSERYFIEHQEIANLPFVVNYKSLSKEMSKLRSSTYFYKDKNGGIEYLLSLTVNVNEFLHVRDIIDMFVNGSKQAFASETAEIDQIPKIDLSAHDLIDAVIAEGQKRYGITAERMTKLEKQSIIREMHSRGVFLIKGAVTEAAAKINYSETTIYRYLQKLDKDE